jgi:predicted aldo/keto reductase-like oxidoreductase
MRIAECPLPPPLRGEGRGLCSLRLAFGIGGTMRKKLIGRRDFMKSTLAGFGGLFFLPKIDTKQELRVVEAKGKEKKFFYRILGKTGIRLPAVNMGVMNTDNPSLVRVALDSGMLMLDTAQTYQRGQNEGMIGEVLKGRPRDSYVIATKAHLPNNRTTGLYTEEATEEAFLKKVDASLRNLGLDCVDIYYHHNVWKRESALYEPILKALEKVKKAGKARFVGVTTHMNEPEVIHAAIDSKLYDVILTSYNFQQKHYSQVREAISRAAQTGIGIIGMKAIRGGSRQTPAMKNTAAALKWVLQDSNVTTIVPGFTTFEQMKLDLAVAENPILTDPEKRDLQKEVFVSGLYCQGCRQCLGPCPEDLPIPDLMRAYMYTYGYRNLAHAQDLVLSLNLPDRVCEDCAECAVKCSVGFNVSNKIRDVVRLRDVPSELIG